MRLFAITITMMATTVSTALAAEPIPVSEPGTFGIFAAAIAAAVVGIRLLKK